MSTVDSDEGSTWCGLTGEMSYEEMGWTVVYYRKYTAEMDLQGLPCIFQGVLNTAFLRLPPTSPQIGDSLRTLYFH